jgi:hypothetical protein
LAMLTLGLVLAMLTLGLVLAMLTLGLVLAMLTLGFFRVAAGLTFFLALLDFVTNFFKNSNIIFFVKAELILMILVNKTLLYKY